MFSRLSISLFLSVLMVSMTQIPLTTIGDTNNEFEDPILTEDSEVMLGPFTERSFFEPPASFIDSARYIDSKWPTMVTTGAYHTCLVYDDGSMTCAGKNSDGRLGYGLSAETTNSLHLPVNFPEDVHVVKAVAGWASTCAIDSQGRLWCWGYNNYGQIGVGDVGVNHFTPQLVNLGQNQTISDVDIGEDFTCALTNLSRLYCWGYNNYGQLNNESFGTSFTTYPMEVVFPNHIVPVSITAEEQTACILSDIGAVYCWGKNNYGQLGDGTTTTRYSFVQTLLPKSDPAIDVKTGGIHTCALLSSGDMRCWGYNNYLQSEGAYDSVSHVGTTQITPRLVSGLPLNPISFDLGKEHTCVVLLDQSIKCFGLNSNGQLGDGAIISWSTSGTYNQPPYSEPRDVKFYNPGFSDPIDLSLGMHTSCGIFKQGRAVCWGHNGNGMIGDETTSYRSTPVASKVTVGEDSDTLVFNEGISLTKAPIIDGMNVTSQITPQLPSGLSFNNNTGAISYDGQGPTNPSQHTVIFSSDGDTVMVNITIVFANVNKYGDRISSYLGGLSMDTNSLASGMGRLSSAHNHTCLTTEIGELRCWGDNAIMTNFGYDSTIPTTISISDDENFVSSITTSELHDCAMLSNGIVKCWGEGDYGRLGNGAYTDYAPDNAVDVGLPTHLSALAITSGNSHGCAITDIGVIWCWGNNHAGQLGTGSSVSESAHNPASVDLSLGRTAKSVSAGDDFTCAVLDNGSISCWGNNMQGQLGDGNTTNQTSPVFVQMSAGNNAVAISSGTSHSCSIISDGRVICWGRNNVGQLGDNSLIDRRTPVFVQLPASRSAVMISAGATQTCAVLDDGSLFCWGLNANGQLGDGTTTFSSTPVSANLPNGRTAVLVATGFAHTCALMDNSELHCWGLNDNGQLGDGSTTNSVQMREIGWTDGEPTTTYNFAINHLSKRNLLLAGWGIDGFTNSSLPAGYSLSHDTGEISWDGTGIETNNNVQISAISGSKTKTIVVGLNAMSGDVSEGKISSFSLGAGFTTPSSYEEPVEISVGTDFSCLRTNEETNRIKCWGYDGYGQMGVSSPTTQRISPTDTYDSYMTTPVEIDTGSSHTCAIDDQAEVWCWGYNGYGQLGHTSSPTYYPNKLDTLDGKRALQLSSGSNHNCILTTDWDVFCWGRNNYGQLGDNTNTNRNSPVRFQGLGNSIPVMVSAGYYVTCVLMDNGSVGCRGYGPEGTYGDGTTNTDYDVHWADLPLGRSAISIDAGFRHVCAILDDQSLVCWGDNNDGQIGAGDSTSTDALTPTTIIPSGYNVIGVSAFDSQTCAWLGNGTALCWGANNYGQLGIGNTTQMLTPAWVNSHTLNSERKIVSMNSGKRNTCAIYDDRSLSCWGDGYTYYQNGDQSRGAKNKPSTEVSGFEGVTQQSANLYFVEGIPGSKQFSASGWGYDVSFSSPLPVGLTFYATNSTLFYDGSVIQTGTTDILLNHSAGTTVVPVNYGTIQVQSVEGRTPDPWMSNASISGNTNQDSVQMLDAGLGHTCLVEVTDGAMCWGRSDKYQTGYGSSSNTIYPRNVYNTDDRKFHQISTGTDVTCGINQVFQIECWGYSYQYRTGYSAGHGSSSTAYPQAHHSNSEIYNMPAASVSVGGAHSCAIMGDATTWCWGLGNLGQIGSGGTYSSGTLPQMVKFPNNKTATSISSGGDHFNCAILNDASIACWGYNDEGQLGLGNTTNQHLPVEITLPPGRSAYALSSGFGHACAILDDWSIVCWGDNQYGQLGDGTADDRHSPTPVIAPVGSKAVQISAGSSSTCAIFDGGEIKCWGDNGNGQLGTGNTISSNSLQLVIVEPHLTASQVSVGYGFACALFHDGSPRCWGYNGYGQLGDNSATQRSYPVVTYGFSGIVSNTLTLNQGTERSIPVSLAGWDFSSSVSTSLPPGMTWNQSHNMIDVGPNTSAGTYYSSLNFNAGTYSATLNINFVIHERIDPWSDRIPSHSLGLAVLDDTETLLPSTVSAGKTFTCFTTFEGPTYCQGYNFRAQTGIGGGGTYVYAPTKVQNSEHEMLAISNGQEHSCAIDFDGTVVCWGYGIYGQLGDGSSGSTHQRNSPYEVSSFDNMKGLMVAAGGSHSCSIMDDLNLYCWGYTTYGQLGEGTQSGSRKTPQLVTLPDGHRAIDISTGHEFSCAILDNGSVACWGDDRQGQLGNGNDESGNLESTPVYAQLPPGRQAVAISLGREHACAILDNNSVYCWGDNDYSALGIGTQYNDEHIPIFVDLPVGANPVQISAGERHSCAVLENGSLYCWGYNGNDRVVGPISPITDTYINTPTFVELEYEQRVVSIALGYSHTCAITEFSELICWGSGSQSHVDLSHDSHSNQIRYVRSVGTTKLIHQTGWASDFAWSSAPPSRVSVNNWILSVESNSNASGNWGWQINTSSQTITGSIYFEGFNIDSRPNSAPSWAYDLAYRETSSSMPMVEIDAGYAHACGILADGKLVCWGENSYGKLGDGSITRRIRPTEVLFPIDVNITQVSSGQEHTCAITETALIFCWGKNDYGGLGIGTSNTISDYRTPQEVMFPWDKVAVMVKTGTDFSCALFSDGSIWCWGRDYYGQLGDGGGTTSQTGTESTLPVKVKLPEGRFAKSIDIGGTDGNHACAIMDDGGAMCWGNENRGNLGTGYLSTSARYIHEPVKVELPSNVEATFIAIGYRHGCAAMIDTTLWCWGWNAHGEVGDGTSSGTGTTNSRATPVQVDTTYMNPIIALGAGGEATCALHDDGSLSCWGENEFGKLGDGTNTDRDLPTQISLDGGVAATRITVGADFTCATASDGGAQCWGLNSDGQLGDSSYEQRPSPGQIYLTLPSLSTVLTYLEGEIAQNEPFVSGWNYSFSVSPPLPTGFSLDNNTGVIFTDGNSVFGVTKHIISAVSDSYTASDEITIAVFRDTDGDGIPDTEDYDDDDDGHLDGLDNCPTQAGTSSEGGYTGCPDADGDGWADVIDPFDDDPTQWKDTDGDGYGDNPNGTNPDAWALDATQWVDDDGDGYGDNEFGTRGDSCPSVEGYSYEDRYGCIDIDGDGWSDEGDAFPDILSQWKDRDGDGYGDNLTEGAEQIDIFPSDGTQWADSDGDGHGDNKYGTEGDWFPSDPERWADTDRDGVADEDDDFPNDATQSSDTDGDGYGDDPFGNRADEFPNDANEWKDTDGDGVGNNADAFPFDPTQTLDRDGDGYGDNPLGSGADLFPDNPSQWEDGDGDGYGDNLSGTDPDPYLNDYDNDGYNDSIDVFPSFYSPGDLDNDGVPDENDLFPSDYREWSDFDGDGEGDNADTDDDNDGWADTDEMRMGTDPFSASDTPVDSFEVVVPGTAIGLGAWDLMGIFGGVPLFSWLAFGFATRNARCARYEEKLKAASSRHELEEVAFKWEYSLMLRLLGPHQGIRLERLRGELEGGFAAQEVAAIPMGFDQTAYVMAEDTAKNLPVLQTTQPPPPQMAGKADEAGYEWLDADGAKWYRVTGSGSEWTKWE